MEGGRGKMEDGDFFHCCYLKSYVKNNRTEDG